MCSRIQQARGTVPLAEFPLIFPSAPASRASGRWAESGAQCTQRFAKERRPQGLALPGYIGVFGCEFGDSDSLSMGSWTNQHIFSGRF